MRRAGWSPARCCPSRRACSRATSSPRRSDEQAAPGAEAANRSRRRRRRKRDARRSPLPPRISRSSRRTATALLARARAAGVGVMVTISTRIRQLAGAARHRGGAPQRLLLGRHASPQRARGARHPGRGDRAPLRAPEGGRHRRGGPRLLLQALDARGAGGRLPPPHRSGAVDRPAARDPYARRR